MASYYFSPLGNSQQLATSGAPLNAGTITTFQAGTSTPQATYTDNAGSSPSTTLTLNTYGLPSNPVWLLGGQAYKFVIKDSLGNTIRTLDNVIGIDDAIAITADQKARIPAFSAYLSANQSLTSGVATKVLFDVKEFDLTNTFSGSRWTPGIAGVYDLEATVALQGATIPSVAIIELWVSGAAHSRLFQQNGASAGLTIAGGAKKVQLLATDFVEIYVTITATTPTVGGQVAAPRLSHFSGALARIS